MAKASKDLTGHVWDAFGPGDYPRWTRYQCKNCEMFAQFHDKFSVESQTKHNCKHKAK